MTLQDPEGRLPLHYAALNNDLAAAQARIGAGDDPNLGDQQGFTPLHLAAQQGSLDVARFLLEQGAVVDKPNSFGNTPLFVAVFHSQGRGELIELFRNHGADPTKQNNSGQTPVGLARLMGNYDVARYFRDLPE